ncbi:hypothetical protein TNCV_575151 [Trichonephila clavipes]|nr:hypothetical protein TNCV_575151 [Trichonephila clavipes]
MGENSTVVLDVSRQSSLDIGSQFEAETLGLSSKRSTSPKQFFSQDNPKKKKKKIPTKCHRQCVRRKNRPLPFFKVQYGHGVFIPANIVKW